MTPQDWAGDLAIQHGATFNLSHSLDQMLCFRPHNRFEDIDGMYLVGGGTHPGSGLPVIFESARITSRLLAEDLDLPGDWPQTAMPMTATEMAMAPEVAEMA
jgi:phytoene desaturase